jgi:amino acid transporter
VARFFTIMVLWTCVGSCVALLLGYSRIPYAAARAGDFFAVFGKLHPTRAFPHVSLIVIGVLAIAGAFIRFGVVLDTLIATRILVQFAGQIAAVVLLRRHQPNLPRPYRIWLYPAPLFLAGVGWTFVYCTLPLSVMLFSVAALIGAILLYIVWRKGTTEPGSPTAS